MTSHESGIMGMAVRGSIDYRRGGSRMSMDGGDSHERERSSSQLMGGMSLSRHRANDRRMSLLETQHLGNVSLVPGDARTKDEMKWQMDLMGGLPKYKNDGALSVFYVFCFFVFCYCFYLFVLLRICALSFEMK